MSLFIASLNSGSNGNCYYIGNKQEAILVDAGISCRETERRLKRLELSMKKVKAIFVTHEHADHIYGVSRLSRRFDIPVYITDITRESGRLKFRDGLSVHFTSAAPVTIGALSVTAFPVSHDANDPHNFIVSCEGVNVGVFTDIGRPSEVLTDCFARCHAAFLESNYDEAMLETGSYPPALKNRIRDGKGHLSNTQALQIFLTHRPPFMTHLFLSHLSENNNTPKIVRDLFKGIAGTTEIVIAPRHKETEIYHISHEGNRRTLANPQASIKPSQLSLFQ